MFPSSRAEHHLQHKIKCGHTEVLRFSSIYGANGAGKSNLIRALNDLQVLVRQGSIWGSSVQPFKFQLTKECLEEPVSLAIEFSHEDTIYYYSIEFDTAHVNYEALYISKRSKDALVFERKGNGSQSVVFGKEYQKGQKNKLFFSVLEEKLLNKDALLLSFMAVNYPDEIKGIKESYSWILNKLLIVKSDFMKNLTTVQALDTNPEMMDLLKGLLPGMNTGISNMTVERSDVDEDGMDAKLVSQIKSTPGQAWVFSNQVDQRINVSLVFENGKIVKRELQPFHLRADGEEIKMPISFESDGTIRLIEYVPVLYLVLNQDCTVVIDEMERSLHPILVKEIIRKLSESHTAKGQMVFTTHESSLLDQEILRPDEIWFAQKDQMQATQLYPLSDFNIHKTASIENGYLIGRYGGIPFMSNLKDLNW